MMVSEKQARDKLERIGVLCLHSITSGDLAEIAQIIAGPKPVDCRTCKNSVIKNRAIQNGFNCISCTNGDKYQALPVVQLYRK